jgi:hypothetical protein
MNKKYLIILALVVVVVVAIIVVAVVILPGLFTPPVDISGINPSTNIAGSALLPATLAGKQLDQESVDTSDFSVSTFSRDFVTIHTTAQYEGVTVHIFKAQSTSDGSDLLGGLFSDDGWYGGASSSVKTNDWFTVSKAGRSAFVWRSSSWVFGVDAENDAVRNSAARDLVQYLKTF